MPRAWVSVSATLYMCTCIIGICTVYVYVDVYVYVYGMCLCMLTGGRTHINRGQTTHEQLQLAAGEDGNEIGRHQLVEALLEGIDLLSLTHTHTHTHTHTQIQRHIIH